jgi:DNA-directed RNA polymerase specialized sigma24 family protein
MFSPIVLPDVELKNIDTNKLQLGDVATHNLLYRLVFDQLCLKAAEVLAERDVIPRLVNHAFIRCWVRAENLYTIDEVIAFLYMNTRNNCQAYSKKSTAYEPPNDLLIQTVFSDTLRNGLSRQQLLAQINGKTGGEREIARQIFDWLYSRFLTAKEIAEEIDIPLEIIMSREHLGKQMMHLILSLESCST